MTYKDLVNRLANQAGISRGDADHAIKSFSKVILSGLKEGEKMTIPNFGKFSSEFKPEKVIKSPKGKEVTVPDRIRPKFNFSPTVIEKFRQD